MEFSLEQLLNSEKRYRANLINSLTGFKSVSLIGSRSKSGNLNLAIFSQIIHIGASPPLMGILFRPDTVSRHTLENIMETDVFTINHIHESFYKQAHHTSARWEMSEFEGCQLTSEFKDDFAAPFVLESPLQISLKFKERLDVQSNGTHLIVGAITKVYVKDDIIEDDGFVDLEKAGIVTCSGLDKYHLTKELSRLSYAKPDHFPTEI